MASASRRRTNASATRADAGSSPMTDRAPALSMTLWVVLAVYELESRFVPLAGVRRALASLGALVVVLAWLFPGQVYAQATSLWAPLAGRSGKVLRTSVWAHPVAADSAQTREMATQRAKQTATCSKPAT